MRSQLLLLLLIGWLTACSLLQEVPPVFTGNTASELPFRIKSFSYPDYRKGVPYKATARYRYDNQNRLLRIDSIWTNRSIVYRYVAGRVSERLTYVDTAVVFRESFTYSAIGQLEKLAWRDNHNFTRETTYQYDAAGQLTEKILRSVGNTYVSKYIWKEGNLVATVNFDGNGKKTSEWSYTYDSQPNYQALLIVDPDVTYTRNNRISTRLDRDYTGLIDLCANPNVLRFSYRPDGLPKRWESNSCGQQYNEIEYEPKQP